MFRALLGIQLASLKQQFSGVGKKKQTTAGKGVGKAVLMALLFLYVSVVFGGLFYIYFSMMAQPFHDAGLSWLFFALLVLMAFALMFIGSVFTAKAQLFEPNDTELLLSMPIKPAAILSSRLISLLLLNYALELVVVIGAGLGWFTQYSLPPVGLIAFGAIVLLLPLLSLAISALFAWLLSVLTRKIRRKALFSLLLSLVMMGAYMYVMFQLNNYITQIIAQMDAVAQAVSGILPLYWMGSAIASGSILHLVLSLLVLVIPFAIAFGILSATFIKAATSQHGTAKIRYVEREHKVSSPFQACLQKEWQRLVSSATYMLNAGLGLVFLVIGIVFMIFKAGTVQAFTQELGTLAELVPAGLVLVVGMMNSMTLVTAPSVSLEGRSIWIPQSMPLDPKVPLQAKLALQLLLALPVTVLASLVIILILRPAGTMLLCCIALPQVFTCFGAVLGLSLNLKFTNLNWRNEAQVIKNGASIILTMLLNWLAAILIPVALLVLGVTCAGWAGRLLLIYTLILALITWLLYRWITTHGTHRFAWLS